MADIRDTDSGASQPLALLFLAGLIVLVVVLGFFMLTGHATAACTSVQTSLPDNSIGVATHSASRISPNALRVRRRFDNDSL
jgi:hypothetical protein